MTGWGGIPASPQQGKLILVKRTADDPHFQMRHLLLMEGVLAVWKEWKDLALLDGLGAKMVIELAKERGAEALWRT